VETPSEFYLFTEHDERRWTLFVMREPNVEVEMDKDRIEGAKKQVVGSVKEALGKVTGNDRVEAEGAAEKTEGKVQGKVGEAKDKARDALK
jgi:uncharacterized protein YjbJ (UPF0337 family)